MTDALCRVLDWDSRFFGCRIARVTVPYLTAESCASILAWCKAHGVECLYFLAAPDDAETSLLAQAHDFQLVDVRLDFDCHLTAGRTPQRKPNIRPATERDLPRLRAIASTSHQATRFYFDGRFRREQCDELYRTWIERSCDGFADAVLVAASECEVSGYITMHLDAGTRARIGLVGVAEASRGRGFGRQLLDAALDWCDSHGRTCISVATQARNVPGVRLYEQAGFQVARVGLWYHRWFDDR